ncbi:MAG: hypothetical protein P4L66_09260 [Acetobacteraceae bacterium]|nr:hypothetical protein [Acetobacteraceae bacterium]
MSRVSPLHASLAGWIGHVRVMDDDVIGTLPQGLACMAVVLALSTPSFPYFERPAQNWLKQLPIHTPRPRASLLIQNQKGRRTL